MRAFVQALAIVIGGAAISGTALAAASGWKQYMFEDDGYIVEFPAEPQIRTGTYTSQLVRNAPTRYSYYEDANNILSATVVQGIGPEDSASILNEADYMMFHLGDTTLNLTSRPGPNTYGRYLTINCRKGFVDQAGGTRITDQAVQLWKTAAGVDCPEGGRLTAVIVYRKEAGGRLYIVTGVNKPNIPARAQPNAARFAFSLVWWGANATIVDIVQQRDVSIEEARTILESFQKR